MSNGMNQVELLLRLSENAQEKGDEIAKRHHEERTLHVKQLQELYNMIKLAEQNVWSELSRFGALNENQKRQQLPPGTPQQGPKMVTGAGNEVKAR